MKFFACMSFLMLVTLADSASAEPPRGYEQFMRYCASCHGEAADGKGPVANVLAPRPPELKHLRERYGSPLGTNFVVYVMGTTMPRSHGTSDMPVWGRNLKTPEGDDTQAVQAIWAIASFLESIQQE